MTNITLAIDDELANQMNEYKEVNWSYIAREGIEQYIKKRKESLSFPQKKKKSHNRIDYYALAEDWYNNYYGKIIGSEQGKVSQLKKFIREHIGYSPQRFVMNKFKEAFESYLATRNGMKEDMIQKREK